MFPTELKIGDKVCLSETDVRVVSGRKDWLPLCLNETLVTFIGGTTERFCNFKNLVVVRSKQN